MTLNQINGISFKISGDLSKGDPIILLKGLGRSKSHWLEFDELLAKVRPVISLDLRGMGGSSKQLRWRDSIFDYAKDIAPILDYLGVAKAHIMGVSLGGMVALAFGMTYPSRCKSLIVMNSSIAGSRVPRLTPRAFFLLVRSLLKRSGAVHDTLSVILSGSSLSEQRQREVASQFKSIAAREGLYVREILKQLGAASRFYVRKKLVKLQVPTLIIYGTNDQFVPHKNSHVIHQLLPNASLVVIHGGGHELELDFAKELTHEVESWLMKQSSAR